MRVQVNGSGIVVAASEALADQYILFPTNWSPDQLIGLEVTGDAPNRLLVDGASILAHEVDDLASAFISGGIGDANAVHKGDLMLNVADTTWGTDPFGTNPRAALAAATTGQTVYFPPGTYTSPTGVGNGYTVVADGVTVVAGPGVTINVATWGQPGIDCFNRSDVTITGRLKVVYTGVRGNHAGTLYRGSSPYANGCGVYINRDRCRVEGLRTVGMPVGVTLSSYNGTSGVDRIGVGNVIEDLEVEGANFGIFWVGQRALRINNYYAHDDIDDSGGANPTHAYYCSANATMGASDITISNVVAENILGGQAFQLKYCTGVRLSNHVAVNCKGLFNGIDLVDLQSDNMGGSGLLANGGQGAITLGTTTNTPKRIVLNNTVVSMAVGVDERAIRLDVSDAEVNDMLVVTSRPSPPANPSDYEFIVTGHDMRLRGITIRSRGAGHVRAFLLGSGSGVQNVTLEDFLCESTIGLVDTVVGSTGVAIKYSPGQQQSIISGSLYIGTLGGAATYSVSRTEHERTVTVASGSTTATPNPYLETRTHINVTDSSNFTIAAPAGGTPNVGTTLEVVVTNSSGGTLGTVTWNAAYVFSNAYVKPVSGASTVHRFRHNGTSWISTAVGSDSAASASADIQLFTTVGTATWTKPTGAKTVEVTLIGPGGGGGSGRRGASGSVCGGGGGGGGGLVHRRTFQATELSGTVTVTIGAGGTGGAAVTANDTNGNAGGSGGATSFGTYIVGQSGIGSGGSGGTTAGGAGALSQVTGAAATSLGSGGVGGASAAGAGVNAAMSLSANGGAGGGGISVTPAAFNGGLGSKTMDGSDAVAGAAGVVDTTAPTAGTDSATACAPGQSAGGGASSITTAAQAGATATGKGAGGGGGGAALNGNNSGAGGDGAPAAVRVITYF